MLLPITVILYLACVCQLLWAIHDNRKLKSFSTIIQNHFLLILLRQYSLTFFQVRLEQHGFAAMRLSISSFPWSKFRRKNLLKCLFTASFSSWLHFILMIFYPKVYTKHTLTLLCWGNFTAAWFFVCPFIPLKITRKIWWMFWLNMIIASNALCPAKISACFRLQQTLKLRTAKCVNRLPGLASRLTRHLVAQPPVAHPPSAILVGRMPTYHFTLPSTIPANFSSTRPLACLTARKPALSHTRPISSSPARLLIL